MIEFFFKEDKEILTVRSFFYDESSAFSGKIRCSPGR